MSIGGLLRTHIVRPAIGADRAHRRRRRLAASAVRRLAGASLPGRYKGAPSVQSQTVTGWIPPICLGWDGPAPTLLIDRGHPRWHQPRRRQGFGRQSAGRHADSLLITNGLTTLSAPGGVNRMVLAGILLLAAMIDIRWVKNRYRIISKVYVSPTYHAMPPVPATASDSGTPFALNDRLRDVTAIALGRIEAPEDVILDREDNLYAGSRHGDVIRFFAPDYERMEVYAHIGGQPLGMAFDRADNLYVCIGGMGLYRVTPQRKVERATDETKATPNNYRFMAGPWARWYSSTRDGTRLP